VAGQITSQRLIQPAFCRCERYLDRERFLVGHGVEPRWRGKCHDPRVTRRTNDELDGDRESGRMAIVLGTDLRRSRRRARLTQEQLGERVGVRRTRIGELELGKGASAPLALWVRLGKAVDRPFAASFSRDLSEVPEPVDAGHLAAQELVLRLARRAGRSGAFELPTRPSGSSGVVDVAIRDDAQRVLILVEIWNRLTDLGAASRSTSRKTVEVEGAILPAGFRLGSCWLLVDHAANRYIVRRYPEIVRTRFPGSSLGWVRALVDGSEPPSGPGIAWVDPRSGTITELRLRG
jgi:transcriptional regulator with XRE-family HTH domain